MRSFLWPVSVAMWNYRRVSGFIYHVLSRLVFVKWWEWSVKPFNPSVGTLSVGSLCLNDPNSMWFGTPAQTHGHKQSEHAQVFPAWSVDRSAKSQEFLRLSTLLVAGPSRNRTRGTRQDHGLFFIILMQNHGHMNSLYKQPNVKHHDVFFLWKIMVINKNHD